MRKGLSTILFFIIILSALGQKQKVNYLTTFDDKLVHFGFTLGLNTLDFAVVNYNPIGGPEGNPDFVPEVWQMDDHQIVPSSRVRADIPEVVPGFTVGIISSLRLARDFNLRFQPGLSFGDRKLAYNIPVIDETYYEPLDFYSIKSTFLDFPILIKYKARRINNDRPYLVFGTAYRQDISKTGKEDLVKLKNGSLYAEIGTGWDHYFTFFRFSVEAKFSFGLNNQLGPTPAPTQRQYYARSI